MPIIVQPAFGRVTGLWGTAQVRTADGRLRPLELGDLLRKGDVVLTSQDGIVQITEEPAERHREAAQPADDFDRVIAALDSADPDAAPAAGGGDGRLDPGLRVGRVSESVTPASLLTDGPQAETVAFESYETAPEEQLPRDPAVDPTPPNPPIEPPRAGSSTISAAEEGAPVALGLPRPEGSVTGITVDTVPTIGEIRTADGRTVAVGDRLTPDELSGLVYVPPADYDGRSPVGDFGYTAQGPGGGASGSTTIDLQAVNDLPVASSTQISATEEGAPVPLGLSAPTDADGDALTITVTSLPASGTITRADGTPLVLGQQLTPAELAGLLYTPPTDVPPGGASVDFGYSVSDGTATTTGGTTIALTPVDDPAVVSSGSGNTSEDGPPVTGTLTATDADNPGLAFVPGSSTGAYGNLVLSAGGDWTYTLAPAAQALAAGQVVTETFTVALTDGSTTTVTITVTGTDDAPVISAGTGAIAEDQPPVSGQLTASDADNPGLAFVPANPAGSYGSLAIDATGAWSYTLGPSSQALAAGQVVTEAFTVTLTDGSTTTVTITVTGTDDAPVISAGTGAITEDQPPISGQLTATDADNPGLAFVPANPAGSYGSLTLDATGAWTYTLGTAAQALAAGQVATETFTVALTDGSTTTVTITVTGTDDAPVISAGTGAITEDQPPISGALTATDVDNPGLAFVPANPAGSYGSLAVDATGAWTYTLGPAAQALAAGQVATETFTVALNDGSTTTVTITVTGTDDAPVISAGTGAITEDAPPISGTLTATDADNPALAFLPGSSTGAYGNLVLSAGGDWTYTLAPAAQALAAGQVVTETFTVALNDGSTTTVTITVTGTDDAPVISSATGAIREGAPPISGNLSATDADNPGLAFVATSTPGAYGTLQVDAAGAWSYALGPTAAALAEGQVVTEVFTVTLTDGSTTSVTITVTGTDSDAVVSSGTGAITEDAPPISGTLTATDPDNPALAFVPANPAGSYGSLAVDATGAWSYTLGPASQALAAGQVVTETFTVALTDGSTTTVTITVTGTDDAPVISAGTGAITEDQPPVSGQLTATDVDNPALAFVPANPAGSYGSLAVDATGAWAYTLGPAAQALAAGQVVTEVFTVALNDGSTTTVTITVTGTDDAPVISAGTGAITEDQPPISGTLTATDADNPALAFVPGSSTGAYGNLVLSAGGDWTYTLAPAAQALAAGQVVTETFTVALNDGSTTTVTITVTGTDDAPVISAGTGAITEDQPPISGQLTATDADNPALAFVPANPAGSYGSLAIDATGAWSYTLGPSSQALAAGQVVTEAFTVTLTDGSTTTVTITVTGTDDAPVISAGTGAITEDQPPISGQLTATDADNPGLAFVPANPAGSYGSLTLDATGAWSYTLGPAAQALGVGQIVTETFTVALTDGSTTTVTITVTGTDDAPVVSAGTGAITEDQPPISGTLTASDADNPALAFVPGSSAGAYGSLSLSAGGDWTYTLGPAAQALAAGQVVNETFTVALNDGSTTTVTITVTGTDDAPVISSATGAIREGAPPISGNLSATDADNPGLAFVAASTPGAYGTLQVDAAGAWSYALGPTAAALAEGQVVTETFTVTLTDGSTTSVTITVTGTDSDAVVSSGTGTITEDQPPISGTLTATDPDNPALAFVPANPAGSYGSLAVDATGAWAYTLGPAAQALAAGQVVTEVFTVALNDGSTTTVTITVTGTDDAPVISAGTGAITEDQPPISGTLTATDADNPALAFVPGSSTGAYGNLVLSAGGDWTYTLAPAAQALAAGQVVTETFAVALNDGSTTTVTITVTGTNDAPVATGGSVTGPEDTPVVLDWARFGITDADSAEGTLGVRFDSLPADGALQMLIGGSWTAVAPGQTVGKAVIDAGGLRFVPDAQESGDASFGGGATGDQQSHYTTIAFRPVDGSGPGAAASLTVDITPVADAPTLSHGGQSVTGGSATAGAVTPPSVGLLREHFVDVPTVGPDNAGNTMVVETNLRGVTPTSTAVVSDVAVPDVNVDDAYRFTGFIYMEAGSHYQLSGSRDDTLRIEIGGELVYNQGFNQWGSFSAAGFTPAVSGYYSFEVIQYNGDGIGNLDINLSVNGGPARDLSTSNYLLYPDAATITAGGAGLGGFVPNAEGGYYPAVITGDEDQFITLGPVGLTRTDVDGSESLAVSMAGLPAGSTLTDGTRTATVPAGGGALDLAGWDLSTLRVRGPADFNGELNFSLQATTTEPNGSTASSQLNFAVQVRPVDDAPVISSGSGTITEDGPPISGTLTATDSDNPALAFVTGSSSGSYGSLSVAANGAWTYTLGPASQALAAGQVVTETFPVALNDGSTTTVTITVNGRNDTPVAVDDTISTNEDTPVTFNVLGNDSDVDRDTLRVTEIAGQAISTGGSVTVRDAGGATLGSVTLNANGTLSFTPAPDVNGPFSFQYKVSDGNGGEAIATVRGTIVPVDDLPVARADTFSPTEDTPFVGNLAANDQPSGDGGNVWSLATGAAHGSVSVDANGGFRYVPAANYGGADSFTYRITDANGSVSTATVTLNVVPVADAPRLTIGSKTFSVGTNFEGVSNDFADGRGPWRTDNAAAQVEIADASVYGVSPGTTKVIELERNPGDRSNLYTTVSTEAGEVYTLNFDFAARSGATNNSVIHVYWEGQLVQTLNGTSTTLSSNTLTLVATTTGSTRLEFIAGDSNSLGGVLDNISLQLQPNTGIQGYLVPLPDLTVALTDTDGSEQLTTRIGAIPVGSTLTDGVHSFTAVAGNTSADVSDWDLTHLAVTPPAAYTGPLTLDVTATATEPNGSSASTSQQVTVNVLPDVGNLYGTVGNDSLTGTSGDDRIWGLAGDDTLAGGAGRDVLIGGAGNDQLLGQAGDDVLEGGTGNDVLVGGAGADVLEGGAGNDTLSGGTGTGNDGAVDVFRWHLGDAGARGAPAIDTIRDFSLNSGNSNNGDVLDLRDLLTGESNATLSNYLDFNTTSTPGSTVIRISTTGGFTGGNYSAGAEDQRIVLEGTNLRSGLGLSSGASDADVIQQLLNQGKLITDNG